MRMLVPGCASHKIEAPKLKESLKRGRGGIGLGLSSRVRVAQDVASRPVHGRDPPCH